VLGGDILGTWRGFGRALPRALGLSSRHDPTRSSLDLASSGKEPQAGTVSAQATIWHRAEPKQKWAISVRALDCFAWDHRQHAERDVAGGRRVALWCPAGGSVVATKGTPYLPGLISAGHYPSNVRADLVFGRDRVARAKGIDSGSEKESKHAEKAFPQCGITSMIPVWIRFAVGTVDRFSYPAPTDGQRLTTGQ